MTSVAEGEYGTLLRTVDLKIGEEYEIRCFKSIKTKFGQRLTVHFVDGTYMFLPPRFSEKIKTSRQVDELNAISNHFMIFGGKDDTKGGFLKLKFIVKE